MFIFNDEKFLDLFEFLKKELLKSHIYKEIARIEINIHKIQDNRQSCSMWIVGVAVSIQLNLFSMAVYFKPTL